MIMDRFWRSKAACKDREDLVWIFTGSISDLPKLEESRKLCLNCPVVDDCRESAEEWFDDEFSIRGGLMPRALEARVNRDTRRKEAPRKSKHVKSRGLLPYWPTLLRDGKCTVGHEINGADDLNFYMIHGKQRSQCKACQSVRKRGKTAKATKCSQGHAYNLMNTTYVTEKGGKERRFCRICNSLCVERLLEKQSAKMAV